MSTLVISLETIGQDWDNLSTNTKESLTKWMEREKLAEVEKVAELNSIKANLSLSPFTAEIVSIALYDVERELSAVYYLSEGEEVSMGQFKIRTEKEMLEDFWEGVRDYDTIVTFNGRAFTLPFLLHRSAILKIKPTVEFAKERYLTKQTLPYHIDLLEEFTFYGAMPKRPSLDLLCEVFQIKAEAVFKLKTAELFQQKKFRQIAVKNESKVQALRSLYEIWKQYYAPLSFLNTVD